MDSISLAMETMMHKSLTDLVRGIRTNKKNESKYITRCLAEIKEELKSTNYDLKAIAVQKLTYLQMLGYDMSWAAFNVVEVMSQSKFTAKRIGYLGASQSFHEGTDVIILTQALFKKDLQAQNQYEIGLALNCIANICTTDIARDLAADIVGLLNSSRVYVRKKAVLALYRVFLKFPDSLRPAFPRLKEKLEDLDNGVVSSAVNVICELARKNPKNYLALAPILFKILTSSNNNWMLIKIIKLFGALTPLEKRLGKKLIEPLTNLINSTTAMSLLYECIQTCTIGLSSHTNIIRLCISKLRVFVEDADQNLKYLGLLALHNIMKAHPKAVTEHRDLIIWCLDDEDVTIRLRALDLLVGMVTKKNIMELVRKLMEKQEKADGSYRDELVEKIITICSQGTYQYITDFEWYISVLIELTHIPASIHGKLISSQLMDVIVRVKMVRSYGVKNMAIILNDSRLLNEASSATDSSGKKKNTLSEVLYACAWICGEFAQYLDNHKATIEALLQPRVAVALPEHIQSVYMQNVLKVFTYVLSSAANIYPPRDEEADEGVEFARYTEEDVKEIAELMKSRLPDFTSSNFTEVQERACFLMEMMKVIGLVSRPTEIAAELNILFSDVLNPVAKSAAKKAAQVGLPPGLNLDEQINEIDESDEDEDDGKADWGSIFNAEDTPSYLPSKPLDPIQEQRAKEARQKLHQGNAYYLVDPKKSTSDNIPPVALVPVLEKPSAKTGYLAPRSDKKKRKMKVKVMKTEDLPEGADLSSDSEDEKKKKKDDDPLANIDLSLPIRSTEVLTSAKYPAPVIPSSGASFTTPAAQQLRSQQQKQYDTRPDKEKKEKRHRRDKKERHSRDKTSKKDKKRSSEGDSKATSTVSGASKPHRSSNLLDLDDMSSPAPSAPPVPYTLPVQAKTDRREKDREEKRERSRKESSKKDDKDKRGRRHRDKKSGREEIVDVPSFSKPSTSAPPTAALLLAEDKNLTAIYELRLNPAEKNKITAVVKLRNNTSSIISSLQFAIGETLNMKIVSTAELSPSGLALQPQQTATHQITFQFVTFLKPQRLSGTLTYQVAQVKSQIPLQMLFSVSSFVLPTKITNAQFVSIVQQSSGGPLFLSTNSFSGIPGGLRTTLQIMSLMHFDIIETVQNAASLYGQSVQGHHIAALVKQTAPDAVHVSIKASDQTLGGSLIAELGDLLNSRRSASAQELL